MRRPLDLVALFSLGSSALAFAASVYIFGNWNTAPLSLPVRSDGSWVKGPFHLTTSGAFRLRITVPARSPSGSVPVLHWRGSTCLYLALNSVDAVNVKSAKIDAFRSAGIYEFGGLAYFESENTFQVDRGDNVAALRTCEVRDNEQLFVELVRAGNPTDQYFAATAVRGLGWLMFTLGVVSALSSVIIRSKSESSV